MSRHKRTMPAAEAKELLRGLQLVLEPQFVELSWVTGQTPDGYPSGIYITQWSYGDYSDSPKYCGVNCTPRPDGEHLLDWIVFNMPDSGDVTLTLEGRTP